MKTILIIGSGITGMSLAISISKITLKKIKIYLIDKQINKFDPKPIVINYNNFKIFKKKKSGLI